MNGIDAALFVALAVLIFSALAVGVVLAARSPATWMALGTAISVQLIPKLAAYILKRNPPDIEAKMHECVRRGGKWNNFTKRCE